MRKTRPGPSSGSLVCLRAPDSGVLKCCTRIPASRRLEASSSVNAAEWVAAAVRQEHYCAAGETNIIASRVRLATRRLTRTLHAPVPVNLKTELYRAISE